VTEQFAAQKRQAISYFMLYIPDESVECKKHTSNTSIELDSKSPSIENTVEANDGAENKFNEAVQCCHG